MEKRLVKAYKDLCKGIDNKGEEVLSKGERIFVKIYNDGSSKPICRLFKKDDYRCLAHEESSKRGQCYKRTSS